MPYGSAGLANGGAETASVPVPYAPCFRWKTERQSSCHHVRDARLARPCEPRRSHATAGRTGKAARRAALARIDPYGFALCVNRSSASNGQKLDQALCFTLLFVAGNVFPVVARIDPYGLILGMTSSKRIADAIASKQRLSKCSASFRVKCLRFGTPADRLSPSDHSQAERKHRKTLTNREVLDRTEGRPASRDRLPSSLESRKARDGACAGHQANRVFWCVSSHEAIRRWFARFSMPSRIRASGRRSG